MKNFLVISRSWSKDFLELPSKTRSSAKKIEEIFRLIRGMPRPEQFSSSPRLLMKMENNNGEILQPTDEIELVVLFIERLIYLA